jgi:alpha-ketoglutarate-dependent taurine dioxygenase
MTTTQVGTKLGIRKITARIGAEITGLAPDLILEPETIAEVRAALNEHKALVFRGVRVDDEDHTSTSAGMGALTHWCTGQHPCPLIRETLGLRVNARQV